MKVRCQCLIDGCEYADNACRDDGRFSCPLLGNNIKEDAIMRTITELYSLEGRVYLFFSSSQTYKHFAETARKEGFALPTGEDDVLALNPDFSFCHTGWAGHLLFYKEKKFQNMLSKDL